MRPILALFVLLAAATAALPQESAGAPPGAPATAALEARIRALEARLAELQAVAKEERDQDELDELLRLAEASGPPPVARPSSTPSILNPSISVIPDFVARFETVDHEPGVFDEIFADRNPFDLRETEIEFRAPVSPEVDGVAILSVGDEEAAFEEAYAKFHSLPWGLQAKVGKFFVAFGRANPIHTHDLPQIDRPIVHQLLFGEEGLSSPGISLSKVLFTHAPSSFVPTYSELTVEAINSANEEQPLFGSEPVNEPGVNTHLKNFWQLGGAQDFEGGLSWLATGNNKAGDESSNVVGADATWRWRDPTPGSFASWLVQGEVLQSRVGESQKTETDDALGGYLTVQRQLDPQWYAGVRLDKAESPTVEDADLWGITPYLTYSMNEFVRMRFQYQYLKGEVGGASAESQGLAMQLTIVFGAHPPEPYWVDR